MGLYPREKIAPQPLLVSLDLYLDTRLAASTTHLEHTADYGALAEEITFILRNSRFKLLESAAACIASHVLSAQNFEKPGAAIEAVRVKIAKPKALAGKGIPTLEIFRRKEEQVAVPLAPGSDEHVIHRCEDSLLIKRIIPAGKRVTLQRPPRVEVTDQAITEGLYLGSHPFGFHEQKSRLPIDLEELKNQDNSPGYLLTVVRGSTATYSQANYFKDPSQTAKIYPISGTITEKQGTES